MDVAAERIDAVAPDDHDGRIVLLKILRDFADGPFVPVVEFFGIEDGDFAEFLETEIVFGDDDAVIERKRRRKRGHRKGDKLGVRDLPIDTVVDRSVDAGIFPAVILVVEKIDQALFPDRIENRVFRIDREKIVIEFGGKGTVIDTEKIFSEHRKGKRSQLLFEVLFVHEKDFII